MLLKEEFGRRMKTAMDSKDVKQAELAKAVDVSPANISNYVLGKAFPPIDTLTEIAKVLDISLDSLCGIENQEKYSAPKTIGDIARAIMYVLNSIPHKCKLEMGSTTESQCVGFTKTDDYGEIPYYEDVEIKVPVISFKIGEIRIFLADLIKMQKLLEEATIDSKFYVRWLNDRIHALEEIPLQLPAVNGISELPDDDFGLLPF